MSGLQQFVPTIEQRFGAENVIGFRQIGAWLGGSPSQLLERTVAHAPSRVAVTDGVRRLEYAELKEQAYALARTLHSLGVRRGDRVLMQLPNWAEAAVTYHAVARLAAVIVPVTMVYRHAELKQMLNNSEAVAVVTTRQFRNFDHAAMFRELRMHCPVLKHVVQARSDKLEGDIDFDAAVQASLGKPGHDEAFGPFADPDQPHVLIYTSGTEATSKGCTHTWNTFAYSARGLAEKVFQMQGDGTMFMPSPVGHATGMMMGIVIPTIAGAGTHLLDIWEPGEALQRIATYRCTASAGATPFVRMMIDASKGKNLDLSSMRNLVCAGAPIPLTLPGEFRSVFPNGRLLQLYGCSEINMMTACVEGDPPLQRDSSAGRPVQPGIESMVVTPEGTVAGAGEDGEVYYRGPGLMLGYWRDPERTAKTIDAQGWYHTGDVCNIDAEGYLRVTGRIKDIIIRGGANISAGEVENYLLEHPRIQTAAVVAYPDEQMGERVCAFVITTPGEPLTLAEVVAFLKGKRISPQKLPERLEVVDEFPMTVTGKIQKFKLREMARQ